MKFLIAVFSPLWASGIVAQAVAAPESFLVEAAKQVPALLVLAWVVYAYNKDRRDSDAQRAAVDQVRDANLVKLGDTCHAFQAQLASRFDATIGRIVEVMDKTAVALGQANSALERHTEILSRLDNAMEKLDAILERQNHFLEYVRSPKTERKA